MCAAVGDGYMQAKHSQSKHQPNMPWSVKADTE